MFVGLIVFGVFLAGGVGISAYAASVSLPGDAMYPLKTTLETVQIGITRNSEARARLYVELAARRLMEMQSLIKNGRYDGIPEAAAEFERDIQLALRAVEGLSQVEPARAIALNVEINSILQGYSTVLMQMLAGIPENVQPVIRHAIETSNSAARDDDLTGTTDDDDKAGKINPDPSQTPEIPRTFTPTITPLTTATPKATMSPVIPGSSDAEDDNTNDNDIADDGEGEDDDDDGGDDEDDEND
jgi:hypothetical protein